MPYLLVLERASGTHKHSVQQALGLLTSTCSVVCLFPQVHSNKLRLAALEVPGFIFLWCLGAQRKGMVIAMKKEMTFEAAGTELDAILAELSDSETPLDRSLVLYARAAELIAFCNETLQKAQITIDEIDAKNAGKQE